MISHLINSLQGKEASALSDLAILPPPKVPSLPRSIGQSVSSCRLPLSTKDHNNHCPSSASSATSNPLAPSSHSGYTLISINLHAGREGQGTRLTLDGKWDGIPLPIFHPSPSDSPRC
ncbi:hypothetical protein CLIM01_10816 [Colletotrichum limetticola]|uniref:Uncharacterized protein n=1 Tax=Colletotrichum limetticola TaxID=1209924 RepID=A0ABQ9PIG5_9PEZI|nr:hypothetical protein CLIM01_10816 [Colletotrichum limetticola]